MRKRQLPVIVTMVRAQLAIPFKPEQVAEIEEAATRAGVTRTRYVREAALERAIKENTKAAKIAAGGVAA